MHNDFEILDMNVKNVADDSLVLELGSKNDYSFIRYETIPEGYYVSKIIHANRSVTRSGKPAYDISYKLIPYNEVCRFLCNGNIDKKSLTKHCVRVRYELQSDHDKSFRNAMYWCGFDESVDIKDTIGVMEIVKLNYPYKGSLGNIEFVTMYDEDSIIEKYGN